MGKFKVGDRVKYIGNGRYNTYNYIIVSFLGNMNVKCYCEELGRHIIFLRNSLELIEDDKPKYNFKYNVDDKVMVNNGEILIIKECCIDGRYSGSYQLSDGFHYKEDKLTLIESVEKPTYVDDLKRHNDKLGKEIEVKEKMNMKKVENIRTGSKVITIPQEKAAPKKVECKTVIITVNNKDYEAVCMPEDEFNLERGIEVALLKSIFGGTKEYSKHIRGMVRFYNDCEKKRKEEDRIVAKREKEIARQKARKERIAEKARKARVDEMSEAFFKAMKDYDNSITDKERNDRIVMDVEKICDAFASKGLINVPNNTVDDTNKDDTQ